MHNFWIVCFTAPSPFAEPYDTAILELDESLSGSASSDDDDDDDESDAIGNLVKWTNRLATRSPSSESSLIKPPASPLTWFHSPPSTQLGFYKAALPLELDETRCLDELRNMQIPVPNGRTWAMFMVAGGHFAGAVVRVSPSEDEEEIPERRKTKQKKVKPDFEVLFHKTFHRYTSELSVPSHYSYLNVFSPAKAGWFPVHE